MPDAAQASETAAQVGRASPDRAPSAATSVVLARGGDRARPPRPARPAAPAPGPGPRCRARAGRATPRPRARGAGSPRSTPPAPAGSRALSPDGAAAVTIAGCRAFLDLGITLGLLPPGPTGSVLDVPGAGLGHATVWRDEPPPPAGRGTARTGVTVIDPGGDLFRFPVPAGGAVLNGAGECTGMLAAAGVGTGRDARVPDLDHATGTRLRRGLRAAHGRAARDRRRGRDHPDRGRVRRQFPQRNPPDAGAAGTMYGRRWRRPGRPPERRPGSGGCRRRGDRDELPGL